MGVVVVLYVTEFIVCGYIVLVGLYAGCVDGLKVVWWL